MPLTNPANLLRRSRTERIGNALRQNKGTSLIGPPAVQPQLSTARSRQEFLGPPVAQPPGGTIDPIYPATARQAFPVEMFARALANRQAQTPKLPIQTEIMSSDLPGNPGPPDPVPGGPPSAEIIPGNELPVPPPGGYLVPPPGGYPPDDGRIDPWNTPGGDLPGVDLPGEGWDTPNPNFEGYPSSGEGASPQSTPREPLWQRLARLHPVGRAIQAIRRGALNRATDWRRNAASNRPTQPAWYQRGSDWQRNNARVERMHGQNASYSSLMAPHWAQGAVNRVEGGEEFGQTRFNPAHGNRFDAELGMVTNAARRRLFGG